MGSGQQPAPVLLESHRNHPLAQLPCLFDIDPPADVDAATDCAMTAVPPVDPLKGTTIVAPAEFSVAELGEGQDVISQFRPT